MFYISVCSINTAHCQVFIFKRWGWQGVTSRCVMTVCGVSPGFSGENTGPGRLVGTSQPHHTNLRLPAPETKTLVVMVVLLETRRNIGKHHNCGEVVDFLAWKLFKRSQSISIIITWLDELEELSSDCLLSQICPIYKQTSPRKRICIFSGGIWVFERHLEVGGGFSLSWWWRCV